MENYTKQLTENIYLKKLESKDKKLYYVMTTYYDYVDANNRTVNAKKDYFINEQTFKELEDLAEYK